MALIWFTSGVATSFSKAMYEFNSSDNNLKVPHPYKVENAFLLLCSFASAGGGIWVLLQARGFIVAKEGASAFSTGLLAAVLFAAAIKFAIDGLSNLRFIVGRNFPMGLTGELAQSQRGEGAGSASLKEQMRHQIVVYPEPPGLLSGILYGLSKGLATAPPVVQIEAVRHFHGLVGMVAILLSLSTSWPLFADTEYGGVVSWAYLPLTGLSVLAPFKRQKDPAAGGTGRMLAALIGLIAFALLGPTLIAMYIPPLDIPAVWGAPAALLLGSIAATVLYLCAAMALHNQSTQTGVSCEQTVIDMQCHPAQLWAFVGRDMQENWTAGIPNRAYVNAPPEAITGERGMFSGHLIEETQPTIFNTEALGGLGNAMRDRYTRFLVGLSLLALLMSSSAVLTAWWFVPQFPDLGYLQRSRAILTVIGLLLAAAFAFRIGHGLWGRMFFRSRLVWLEVSGTFQSSHLEVGNQMTGGARSRSTVTRIEDATLRVWASDIVTVAFGKNGQRSIIALAENDGYAHAFATRLKHFASDQSVFAAPTSTRDQAKLATISTMSNAFGRQGSDGLEIPVSVPITSPRQATLDENAASAFTNR